MAVPPTSACCASSLTRGPWLRGPGGHGLRSVATPAGAGTRARVLAFAFAPQSSRRTLRRRPTGTLQLPPPASTARESAALAGGAAGQLQLRAAARRVNLRARARSRSTSTCVPKAKQREVEVAKLPEGVRNRVIDAVEALGGRVTVGDVVGQAGVKLVEAEEVLRALASDTLASLEVSDRGEVVYVFPKDPRSVVTAKSAKLRFEPILKNVQNAIGYLGRVAFGTSLFVSLAIVYTAIFVIATSSSDDRGDRRGSAGIRASGGGEGMYYYRPSPFGMMGDMIWYWDPFYYERRQAQLAEGRPMGFLESVFSFVFGDGNPNATLEEARWEAVGNLIRGNGGVVTAEQLAPYLDVEQRVGAEEGSTYTDESYVVPVLQRFQGTPFVDEDNHLLYAFPSLQSTASDTYYPVEDGSHLEEQPYSFSAAGNLQKVGAVVLGAANLVGVVVLSQMLRDPQVVYMLTAQGNASVVSLAASILPALQAYAGLFFAIPLIRSLWNSVRNSAITRRNTARAANAAAVGQPSSRLERKLHQARRSATATRQVLRRDDAVYDTAREVDEQDYEGKEFDRRLRERAAEAPAAPAAGSSVYRIKSDRPRKREKGVDEKRIL